MVAKIAMTVRVVLDTNVIVSALIHGKRTGRIVSLWKNGRIQLLVSRDILKEYYRVFSYPKFQLTEADIRYLVEDGFLAYAETVAVSHVEAVVGLDPSDDKFLACAHYGKAHYLVSGDAHLLGLKEYRHIPIISIGDFLGKIPH